MKSLKQSYPRMLLTIYSDLNKALQKSEEVCTAEFLGYYCPVLKRRKLYKSHELWLTYEMALHPCIFVYTR